MNELKAGVYKHYKGGLNLVIGPASQENSNGIFVVLIPLAVKQGAPLQIVPYDEFVSEITHRGTSVPRYLYIDSEVPAPVAEWYDPVSGYRGADRDDT
jgi:hypothetical protein